VDSRLWGSQSHLLIQTCSPWSIGAAVEADREPTTSDERMLKSKPYFPLGAALVTIYGLITWLAAGGAIARSPSVVGTAAALDLTVSAAVMTWVLGVRRARLPRTAPLLVFGLGLIAARLLLPRNAQDIVDTLRILLGAAELAAIASVLAHSGRVRRRFRALRISGVGRADALEQALEPAVGGPLSRLLVFELSALGLALVGWRSAPPEDARTFSMHRRSHHGLLVAVLLFLVAGETVALHLAIAPHSSMIAWLLSASSGWLALWLVGDAHALRLNPLRLASEALIVTVGVRWHIVVPYDAISAVEQAGRAAEGTRVLRATSFGAADVCIRTTRPLEARGVFGRRRRFDTLLLSVDRPDALADALRALTDRQRMAAPLRQDEPGTA
jgi:hypothetical protein